MGNQQGVTPSFREPDEDESDSDFEAGEELEEEADALAIKASVWRPVQKGFERSDKDALEQFYKNQDGDRWRKQQGWRTRQPLGAWYGIGVDTRDSMDRVVAVSLHHNRLRNDLSKTVTRLAKVTYLEVLNLGHNKLKGRIPTALRWIEHLRQLILNDNVLQGEIPPELFSTLPRLQVVDLSGNKLQGDVASSILLDLARHGTIQKFDVSHNKLEGPVDRLWGSVTSIREIGLGGNKFEGRIPEEICLLEHLERLDLHENRLHGRIPHQLRNIPNLHELRLHGNAGLRGQVPSELTRIGKLEVLSVNFDTWASHRMTRKTARS